METEIRLVFHAAGVVLQRIGFDTIAVLIMVLSLLGMLLAVTLCDERTSFDNRRHQPAG